MFSAILILLVMPFTDLSRSRGIQFRPISKAAFFIFVGNFLILMELGAKHVESPFIEFGQISTVIYFAHFLIIVPLISLLENSLIELASKKGVAYYNTQVTTYSTIVKCLYPLQVQEILGWTRIIPNQGHDLQCQDPANGQNYVWHKNAGGGISGYFEPDYSGKILRNSDIDDLCIAIHKVGIVNDSETDWSKELRKPNVGEAIPTNKRKREDNDNNDGNNKKGGGGSATFAPESSKTNKANRNQASRTIGLKFLMLVLLGISLFVTTFTLLLLFINMDISVLTPSVAHCDAPRPWGIYFQDSATPQMEGLVELHDNILFYLVIILFGVGWLLISIVKNYTNTEAPISHKYLSHGTLIELIWTITPALILILIAFPSFKLLYLMDEVSDPAMAILAEGHQWYWSYQYPDFLNSDDEFIEFDSYLVPESDLEDGALRMLEVDNRLIIPELTHVRFIVTGADVIHSFACPALGIKCDAYPGRLNQVSVMINREGTFYGLRP